MEMKYLNNLKPNDLILLSSEDIFDESVLKKLEEIVNDPLYESEPYLSYEFYESLEKIYREKLKDQTNENLKNRYLLLLLKFFWQATPSINVTLRSKALSSNVVFALRNNLDILKYLFRMLSLYEYLTVPDKKERQGLLYSLSNNEENIGSQNIDLVIQKNVIPSVKNWIKDFISRNASNRTLDHFSVVNYINTNENVRKVSIEDKKILQKILEIYLFLSSPVPVEVLKDSDFKQIMTANKELQSRIPKPPVPVPSVPQRGVQLENFLSKVQAQQTVSRPSVVQKQAVKMTPEEIKREVNAEELPAHTPELSKQHVGTAGLGIKNTPPVRMDMKNISPDSGQKSSVSGIVNLPTMRPVPKMAPVPLPKLPIVPKAAPQQVKILPLTSVSGITLIDDFKKIDVSLLRQGSPASNIELIKEKITSVAQAQRSYPALAVQAFELSPLFKLYLNLGAEMLLDRSDNRDIAYSNASKKLSASGAPVLTLQEFEMVADLKKEIERL